MHKHKHSPQKQMLCSRPCLRIKDNAGLRWVSLEENISVHTFLLKILFFWYPYICEAAVLIVPDLTHLSG